MGIRASGCARQVTSDKFQVPRFTFTCFLTLDT
jgi:hypothetical protein